MKHLILGVSMLLATANAMYGQVIPVRDSKFKEWLLKSYDNNPEDGQITVKEIQSVEYIDIGDEGITDLSGIEYFPNLLRLTCWGNSITKLDLSKNKTLKELDCHNNKLVSLKIDGAMLLEKLDCSSNELNSLDVSNNPNLQELSCEKNKLNSLDISSNHKITRLRVTENLLTLLNSANANNKEMLEMSAEANPDLKCIKVDVATLPDNINPLWSKDETAKYYSDNVPCPSLVIIDPSLGTIDVKKLSIQILNPVKDNLIIKGDAGVQKIEIYNMAGQLVLIKSQDARIKNQDIIIPVQNLVKALYLVKLSTDKGVITQKIIKE